MPCCRGLSGEVTRNGTSATSDDGEPRQNTDEDRCDAPAVAGQAVKTERVVQRDGTTSTQFAAAGFRLPAPATGVPVCSVGDPHVTIVGARTDGLNGVGWPFLAWTSSNIGGTTRCHVRASDARARRMSD